MDSDMVGEGKERDEWTPGCSTHGGAGRIPPIYAWRWPALHQHFHVCGAPKYTPCAHRGFQFLPSLMDVRVFTRAQTDIGEHI